jgi:hypothetical protein
MAEKTISRHGYQWGHFGAIMADTIVFLIIAFLAFNSRRLYQKQKENFIFKSVVTNLTVIIWLSLIFAIITLLGLIPVFKDYDKIIIE